MHFILKNYIVDVITSSSKCVVIIQKVVMLYYINNIYVVGEITSLARIGVDVYWKKVIILTNFIFTTFTVRSRYENALMFKRFVQVWVCSENKNITW